NVGLGAAQSGCSVTLTFNTGGPVDIDPGGSLADGVYQLTIVASQVSGSGGALDGNGDAVGGDDYQTPTTAGDPARLFRLFGDADGNAVVNAPDFFSFRLAFGGYAVAFDYDGNNSTDAPDFSQFRT